MNRLSRVLALIASCILPSACADQAPLFEPGGEAPIRIVLPDGEVGLYQSDTLMVAVENAEEQSLLAQLLLLDSTRTVLWRSQQAPVVAGRAGLVVDGIGTAIAAGDPVLLTALVVDEAGRRSFASDDTVAAAGVAAAAVRTARVWAGRRVRTVAGEIAADVALDPGAIRAYFPLEGTGDVGILDLAGGGSFGGTYDVGMRVGRLDYHGGRLALLGASGDELRYVRPGPAALVGSSALAPLELELDTTIVAAVRPTGVDVAIGCSDPDCVDAYALVPSGLRVIAGSVPDPAAASVLRSLPLHSDTSARMAPLVLPRYSSTVRGDTAAPAKVFAARSPGGSRALVQTAPGVSVCLATVLGGPIVAAGAPGTVYVVTQRGGRVPCGPGTALVRLDGVGRGDPSVSALAVRNTQADDRLNDVTALEVSDSGDAVLALTGTAVLVMDSYLRVRGAIPTPGARAVAWLLGAGEVERFAVAGPDAVTVYDAERLTVLGSVRLGPTAGPLLFLHGPDGSDVLAAPIGGGFVVASLRGK